MTGSGLPHVKPRELIRALESLGFTLVRKSRGSHSQFAHSDGRRTTVPMHAGRDIGPGLLRKILRDISVTPDALKELL